MIHNVYSLYFNDTANMREFTRKLGVLLALAFVLSFLIFTVYPRYCIEQVSKQQANCDLEPLTMVVPESLEEILWGYSTLWSIHRRNLTRRRIYVPKEVSAVLGQMFQPLSLDSLESLPSACIFQEEKALTLPATQYHNIPANMTHVKLDFSGAVTQSPRPLVHSARYMDNEFLFHDGLVRFANRVIGRNIASSEEPPVVVCVWVCRPKWIPTSRFFKRSRQLFFKAAMDIFRRHYRPLFLALGDNVWARHYLLGNDTVLVRAKSIGERLALVAACNHTIVEPTPLCLWAAFRNRGYKVVYDLPPHLHQILSLEEKWFIRDVFPNYNTEEKLDEDLFVLKDD